MIRISIKSDNVGEGKTTIANMIGNFLASLNHEVTIIDDSGKELTAPFHVGVLALPVAVRIKEKPVRNLVPAWPRPKGTKKKKHR